jgi:hypothetical protein
MGNGPPEDRASTVKFVTDAISLGNETAARPSSAKMGGRIRALIRKARDGIDALCYTYAGDAKIVSQLRALLLIMDTNQVDGAPPAENRCASPVDLAADSPAGQSSVPDHAILSRSPPPTMALPSCPLIDGGITPPGADMKLCGTGSATDRPIVAQPIATQPVLPTNDRLLPEHLRLVRD